MSAVIVDQLAKQYGQRQALRDVSFSVAEGEVVALLGPNGAGKTTTLEILEGYRSRSGGRVEVLGCDPAQGGRAWRAQLGLVLQSTSLDEQLTVAETIALYASLYPRPLPIGAVLELVGLAGRAGARVGTLSGGQRRRVDLAVGIVGRPRLLFLDEPTTGFDPASRRQAWGTVAGLRQSGMSVLLTTHYLDEAEYLADRVVVLAGGCVVADATPSALRRRCAGTLVRLPRSLGIAPAALPPLGATVEQEHGDLVVRTADVTQTLGLLTAWARAQGVSLDGITVSRPSLEDTYLALIGETSHAAA